MNNFVIQLYFSSILYPLLHQMTDFMHDHENHIYCTCSNWDTEERPGPRSAVPQEKQRTEKLKCLQQLLGDLLFL